MISPIDLLLYGTPQQKETCAKMEKIFNEFVNEKYPNSFCVLIFFRVNFEKNTATMYFIRKCDDNIFDYEFDNVELPL